MTTSVSVRRQSALAGALYLSIIALGVWSEGVARGSLLVDGDAAATAANVLANEALFRASFAADVGMAVCDVALGIVLYGLLKSAGPLLAMGATAFRLVQATLIGTSLLGMQAMLLLLDASAPVELADVAIRLHGLGYDLGLVFFAVNSVLTGWLVWRSALFPRWIGAGLVATGAVYLLGSSAVLLAPAWASMVEPLYLIPLVMETAFCVALFVRAARG